MPIPQAPDYIVSSIYSLTPQWLSERGIRLVLVDLDNTIARYREKTASPALLNWKAALNEQGIDVFMISNGRKPHRPRVFAESFGVDFIGHAGKPRPAAFYGAMEQTGRTQSETLMIGDQIFTDVWGAHNAGITAVYCTPIALDTTFRKLRYGVEAPFRRLCPNGEVSL